MFKNTVKTQNIFRLKNYERYFTDCVPYIQIITIIIRTMHYTFNTQYTAV